MLVVILKVTVGDFPSVFLDWNGWLFVLQRKLVKCIRVDLSPGHAFYIVGGARFHLQGSTDYRSPTEAFSRRLSAQTEIAAQPDEQSAAQSKNLRFDGVLCGVPVPL